MRGTRIALVLISKTVAPALAFGACDLIAQASLRAKAAITTKPFQLACPRPLSRTAKRVFTMAGRFKLTQKFPVRGAPLSRAIFIPTHGHCDRSRRQLY